MHPQAPLGWVELLTANDWKVMSGKGGVFIISDTANDGPIYHDRGRPFADRSHFIERSSRPEARAPHLIGRYFWAASAQVASGGGARACEDPADLLAARAADIGATIPWSWTCAGAQ